MTSLPVLPILAGLALAAVHLLAHHLRALDGTPRSRWLSAAGGASVAYVFLHLLPEIAHAREDLSELGLLEEELAWMLALTGLVAFYALEALVRRKRRDAGTAMHHEGAAATGAFWLHLGSFAAYNVITGYLLTHGEDRHAGTLGLYALALGLHFLVVDYGLREDQLATWRRLGRWVVTGALFSGLVLGLVTAPPDALVFGLVAFLGGGIVLNVLKEELPEERGSRIAPFVTGAGAYAALLLASG